MTFQEANFVSVTIFPSSPIILVHMYIVTHDISCPRV